MLKVPKCLDCKYFLFDKSKAEKNMCCKIF